MRIHSPAVTVSKIFEQHNSSRKTSLIVFGLSVINVKKKKKVNRCYNVVVPLVAGVPLLAQRECGGHCPVRLRQLATRVGGGGGKCHPFKPVLWIRSDLFRIQLQIFGVPDLGPDPTHIIFHNWKLFFLTLNSIKKKNMLTT